MKGKTYIADPAGILQAQLDFLKLCPCWLTPTERFLLVRYGGLITDARGSMAGNTYSKNRFGKYIRARTKPINPRSSRQSAARVAIMMLAEQWRESPMDDPKRLAWEVYAKGVNWLNKLGETVTLTGFNMFIRSNAALIRAGAAIVTAGPPDIGLPAGDIKFVAVAPKAAGQQITFVFDDTMDWNTEAGGYLVIDAGRPQNPTRNYFGGPWRFERAIVGIDPGGVASPLANVPFSSWTLVEGQKIWIRAHIIRKDGRVSNKFECDPVIVGA